MIDDWLFAEVLLDKSLHGSSVRFVFHEANPNARRGLSLIVFFTGLNLVMPAGRAWPATCAAFVESSYLLERFLDVLDIMGPEGAAEYWLDGPLPQPAKPSSDSSVVNEVSRCILRRTRYHNEAETRSNRSVKNCQKRQVELKFCPSPFWPSQFSWCVRPYYKG